MKIPFDIKYRPQIESEKYKVETRDGRPVRIVCWDNLDSVYPISATIIRTDGVRVTPTYTKGGKIVANSEHHLDLFIIIPVATQIELSSDKITEETITVPIPDGFEAHIEGNKMVSLRKKPDLTEFEKEFDSAIRSCRYGKFEVDYLAWVKARSAKLLALARKEIEKTLPKWKKCEKKGYCSSRYRVYSKISGEEFIYDQVGGLEIPISELEKLPSEED